MQPKLLKIKKFFKTDESLARRIRKKEERQKFINMRGQTAEARRTTILQPVEGKPHSQKDRQDEKVEGYVPDEGTR